MARDILHGPRPGVESIVILEEVEDPSSQPSLLQEDTGPAIDERPRADPRIPEQADGTSSHQGLGHGDARALLAGKDQADPGFADGPGDVFIAGSPPEFEPVLDPEESGFPPEDFFGP